MYDSNNQDPMVRGLALRSLCSLRLPTMVEYISDPLKASLTDANSYVRKTGVMAILKMWHLWPQAVEDGAMVDTLYNMIQDSDAQVSPLLARWNSLFSLEIVFCLLHDHADCLETVPSFKNGRE